MRIKFSITILALMLTGCATIPYQEVIQTGVAGTQMALPSPTLPITTASLPTEIIATITPLPVITETLSSPPETPLPTDSSIVAAQIGQQVTCGNSLLANVPEAPEFNKDLFEHHADGTFLIVKLELINTTNQPIQIWDGDYSVESEVDGKIKTVKPHRAATTYLFIQRGGKLMQDQIAPGVLNWQTNLAFDVDPQGANWVLVVKPGFEGGQALCELRISLTPSG